MSLACPSLFAHNYPALCSAVDIYCERTTPALEAEPLNALTNIAFLIAAACAWRLRSQHPDRLASGLIRTLIALIAIIGLGSFLFHTIATRWAQWGDVIPILLFMLLYLWLVLTSFFAWSLWTKLFALSIFFAATFYLQSVVPSAFLMGGALYLPALFVMAVIGVALYRQQHAAGRAMFAATGVFLLSFTARSLDVPICTSFPLGTHFLWHVLNAILLYLLLRIGILYPSVGISGVSRDFPTGSRR
jgi:hypothetical protein